ncbi:hypothetical protein JHJ32_06595 [Parapedobacter sp. ISTM3]|uniref:hypothetical protein n=1 Tax=Parapedobacter sp. ISTM3 TaxID=2800130 RepID=UPI0019059281|nr:hypothetical protein [Parapedobacter sp. ISTM3]MBK1439647.1 hypothetical protein [Parapedobacter sp. ISTM3]
MKLKDIFSDNKTRVFVVTNQDEGDERNWIIEPTDFDLLPEEENIYYFKKSAIRNRLQALRHSEKSE